MMYILYTTVVRVGDDNMDSRIHQKELALANRLRHTVHFGEVTHSRDAGTSFTTTAT